MNYIQYERVIVDVQTEYEWLLCRNVDYFSARGTFIDAHTVEAAMKDTKVC